MSEEIKTPEEMRKDYEPEWNGRKCEVCESDIEPVVPVSGLCGPCHWGTARALGGAWWHDTNCDLDWEIVDG